MTAGKELAKLNITRQEVASYYNKDVGTIRNWYIDNRRLFDAAVLGYVSYKINTK